MTAQDFVSLAKTRGWQTNTALRLLGTCYLVSRFGWAYLEDVYGRASIFRQKRRLRELGFDPDGIGCLIDF